MIQISPCSRNDNFSIVGARLRQGYGPHARPDSRLTFFTGLKKVGKEMTTLEAGMTVRLIVFGQRLDVRLLSVVESTRWFLGNKGDPYLLVFIICCTYKGYWFQGLKFPFYNED